MRVAILPLPNTSSWRGSGTHPASYPVDTCGREAGTSRCPLAFIWCRG